MSMTVRQRRAGGQSHWGRRVCPASSTQRAGALAHTAALRIVSRSLCARKQLLTGAEGPADTAWSVAQHVHGTHAKTPCITVLALPVPHTERTAFTTNHPLCVLCRAYHTFRLLPKPCTPATIGESIEVCRWDLGFGCSGKDPGAVTTPAVLGDGAFFGAYRVPGYRASLVPMCVQRCGRRDLGLLGHFALRCRRCGHTTRLVLVPTTPHTVCIRAMHHTAVTSRAPPHPPDRAPPQPPPTTFPTVQMMSLNPQPPARCGPWSTRSRCGWTLPRSRAGRRAAPCSCWTRRRTSCRWRCECGMVNP